MTDEPPKLQSGVEEVVRDNWVWFLALGVIFIVLGAGALALPWLAGITTSLFLGWVLLIGGLFQLLHAIKTRKWSGFVLHVLGAILYLFAGGMILLHPLSGTLTLTLLLGIILVMEGLFRVFTAIRLRPRHGWPWFLAGGIAGVILGVLIWIEWPASALWAIGLLVGFNLILGGASLVSVALAARRS